MKLTLAQFNPHATRVEANVSRMLDIITEAPAGNTVIFPEMSVTGYPLEDLALSKELQKRAETAAAGLAEEVISQGKNAIFGSLFSATVVGQKPVNGAYNVNNGVAGTFSKTALPTYGVFDEQRLFEPGTKGYTYSTVEGEKYSVLICEDAWDKNSAAWRNAARMTSDVLIIINGSPYETGKVERRVQVVKELLDASTAKVAVYLNMFGGQDDLVFDGASFVYSKVAGGVVKFMKSFEEDVVNIDTNELLNAPVVAYEHEDIAADYWAIVTGLRDYMQKNGMRSVTLGVSGGIDSAIVATIAADAIGGENVHGISMPSAYSSEHSKTDAEDLMRNLGGTYRVKPIKELFDVFMNDTPLDGIAEENLQARLRGVILMGLSNQEGYLVLSPGNKSELAVGYSTIYGDSVGGYAPIKDVVKTKVYALSRYRNTLDDAPIPVSSIEKPPSAELRPGQLDQESLPEYDVLDLFIQRHIEEDADVLELIKEFGEDLTNELIGKINRAEWKRRQYAIGPKITKKAFGRERFVPITR